MPPSPAHPQPAEADVTQSLLNEWSPSQLCERARQAGMLFVGALWAELLEVELNNRLHSLARGLLSMHMKGSTMQLQQGSLASMEQEVSPDMVSDSPAAVKVDTTTIHLLRPPSAWPLHIKVMATRRSALRWHVHYEGLVFQPPRTEQLELCLDTCY